MENIRLGAEGPIVSRIGIGCEPLGGYDWGDVDATKTEKAVWKALDLGINLFDTADVYGPEISERRLSKALGQQRHDVVIVTKGGVGWNMDPLGGRAETFIDCSPAHLQTALEGSLKRLRIECIPVYLLHWPDPTRSIDEALSFLERQKSAGKIRQFGLSNFNTHEVRDACGLSAIEVIESQYSLIDRRPEEGLLAIAQDHGLGLLAYGVLAQGLLTGKYTENTQFSTKDRRHRMAHFSAEEMHRHYKKLHRLREVGGRRGKTQAQVAIRWALDQPGVSCAIVGAKNPEQVQQNAGAAGWSLTEDERRLVRD